MALKDKNMSGLETPKAADSNSSVEATPAAANVDAEKNASVGAKAQGQTTAAISAYALDTFPHHAALTSSWISLWRTTGGFCVSYFQFKWVARSGTAITFGSQGAVIFGRFFFVIITQVLGKRWQSKFSAPTPKN